MHISLLLIKKSKKYVKQNKTIIKEFAREKDK